MKFSLSIVTLLLGTFVAAEGLSKRSIFGNGQKVLDDKPAVPGDNPLKYCAETHAADLLVLEYVHLDPNPPTAYVSSSRYRPGRQANLSIAAMFLPSRRRVF